MTNKKALGIIFANMHDQNIAELTKVRSMASLPFGGRYRLIDFSLSSLVSAGVTKVGVIAKSNYHSLMDHLGSGREWDLARKNEGLSILPPYRASAQETETLFHGRIQALYNALYYIKSSDVKYVVLMDCDHVANLDLDAVFEHHEKTNADVTMVCCQAEPTEDMLKSCVVVKPDGAGRAKGLMINSFFSGCLFSMNVFVIDKDLLIKMIEDAMSSMLVFFERDVLLANIDTLNIQCYVHDSFVRRIYSLKSYYDANMDLLDPDNLSSLFNPARPVLTKVRDEAPVRYGLNAKVKNCLVADGCVIEGDVKNCVLFRGATVGADAKVRNSIIMQNTVIGSGAAIESIVTDKDVTVSDGCNLKGHNNYPLYIRKASKV
ncbi:MAG: glucose-1-phosphate adenylyltransferase subunit GlgD [Ruminococcaceae bacterium]|nr:glucose-1-phosphate adenylyltransferase subunit GlgD [Oscillospiraceae bacterium]